MRLVFASTTKDPQPWQAELLRHLPELDFRVWPDPGLDPATVDYVLVWKPELGVIGRFPRLKAILSLGAGVDHILSDPGLPDAVPIVRMVDPALTRGMVEYVVHWVLHVHRDFHLYRDLQARRQWEQLGAPETSEARVGVMGLGVLGSACAKALAGLGFDVAGWDLAAKEIPGVRLYVGNEALPEFLARTQILVLQLPATAATRGILDARALATLPEGAAVINPARGELIVEKDLLGALETHSIGYAVLDVFATEPLSPRHPFWNHPKVTVTPHIASLTMVPSAAQAIAANIRRIERGETPFPLAHREAGF